MNAVRVMLADDVEDYRALWRVNLGLDERFDVVGEAANGREAIQRAGELLPDVLLLDLAMPVMDGLQAIPEVHRVSPNTRIVVLSGFMRDEVADQALALTADDYVEKGVTVQELSAKLLAVCASERKS